MTLTKFDATLRKYAELALRVGLNLQAGQRLLVRAPLESAPLVRAVAASAYASGCRLVEPVWWDDQLDLIRFQHARRDSFEEFPAWLAAGFLEHVQSGGALLSIMAEDPDLLVDQDPDLIDIVRRTANRHMQPVQELLARNVFNWAVISYPIQSWARRVFPGLESEQAVAQLWETIFQTCRLDLDDPVAAWQGHIQTLLARCQYLDARQYHSLKFRGPGTDLTVGLAQGHRWEGGRSLTQAGLAHTPNLPTEEIFTTPHKQRVEGVVLATRPRSISGNLIDDLCLRFEGGRVVAYQAATGEAVFKGLLETDEGAARLGEVALVPHSSPISQSGLLFYHALFDENAASHIALGNAYRTTIQGGEALSDEDFAARGGNASMVHMDLMIGSGEVDVDGVRADGASEPLMRAGEWAFDVSI